MNEAIDKLAKLLGWVMHIDFWNCAEKVCFRNTTIHLANGSLNAMASLLPFDRALFVMVVIVCRTGWQEIQPKVWA